MNAHACRAGAYGADAAVDVPGRGPFRWGGRIWRRRVRGRGPEWGRRPGRWRSRRRGAWRGRRTHALHRWRRRRRGTGLRGRLLRPGGPARGAEQQHQCGGAQRRTPPLVIPETVQDGALLIQHNTPGAGRRQTNNAIPLLSAGAGILPFPQRFLKSAIHSRRRSTQDEA